MLKRPFFSFLAIVFFLISCDKESSSPDGSFDIGKGGSLARFTISGNNLYTVDEQKLKSFDITDPQKPAFISEKSVGFGIETIFSRGETLFLGSQTGMYIYDAGMPGNPSFISHYQHIYSCDPVVVEGDYAYVTLSTTSRCGRGINELQIIDIKNLESPSLIKRYSMVQPNGLGIDNNLLFICDQGLKVYDVTDVKDIKLKRKFDISAIDVIPNDTLLMVLAENGLYQYKYKNDNISFLSSLITK